ncbi:hypothetical protein BKI52_09445 [marine bacterium AO1-C]|nr:hypothetical protein BKI52_09445 [marine bacterium AO1-C]
MKTKLFITALLLGGLLTLGWSQNTGKPARQVDKSFDFDNNKELYLYLKFAKNIKIKTWSQNKVQVKVSVDINGGKDNEKYSLTGEKLTDRFEIRSRIKDFSKITKTLVVFNGDNDTYFSYGNNTSWSDEDGRYYMNGSFLLSSINYEISIPANTKKLRIKTISGNVEMDYPKDCQLHARSVSGFIDVSIPSNQKADIETRSYMGDVFSDLSVKTPSFGDKSYRRIGGRARIKGTLNGGGVRIYLKTHKGNIYLRKKK